MPAFVQTTILFAFRNIRALIREYKAIFMMFFTVFSLVTASLIYLHGFNLHLLGNGNVIDDKSRTYVITQTMDQKQAEVLIEEIQTKIAANEIEGILCYADEEVDVDGQPALAAAAYGGVNKKQIALDRGSLELEQSQLQFIMNDIFYQTHVRGDFIHDLVDINGEQFMLNAVGHIDSENIDVIITMAGLQKLCLGVREVHIVFEQRLSNGQLQMLQEIVGEKEKLELPPKYGSAISRQFINRFFVIFALVLMATANIMGFYRYLVMRRKKELLIYKIYGIRNQRLVTILLLETLILVTLGFTAGVILFLAIKTIADQWLPVTAGPFLFLQTYVMIMVCSVSGIVPVFCKIWKKSIISEYSREEAQ